MGTKERIFALAEQKFKDQKEFAEALNAPPSRISGWKTGRSTSYDKYLPELAFVLDTTVEYLHSGEEQKKPADGAVDELELFRQYLKEYNKDLKGCSHEELRGLAQMAALWLNK